MTAGEHTTGYLRWPDLNTHADAERAARHQGEERVMAKVEALAVRVDRIESILDQMRGVRTLMITVFGASIMTALVSVVSLVVMVNGRS